MSTYNYINVVNDVLARFNEAPLTTATFDAGNTGNYKAVKDAVNSALRVINQEAFEWPFNYIEQTETLSAGENRYSYPNNAKTIDFHSFRIKRDNTLGNKTQKLYQMDYEEYLNKHIDDEYNDTNTGIRSIPKYVARAPGLEFVLWPVPDEDYELVYQYYQTHVDLILPSDVPNVPESFRHIITDGAAYYAYQFRSDYENADRVQQKFMEGIENMRKLYINRYEYVRDTRIIRDYSTISTLRTE